MSVEKAERIKPLVLDGISRLMSLRGSETQDLVADHDELDVEEILETLESERAETEDVERSSALQDLRDWIQGLHAAEQRTKAVLGAACEGWIRTVPELARIEQDHLLSVTQAMLLEISQAIAERPEAPIDADAPSLTVDWDRGEASWEAGLFFSFRDSARAAAVESGLPAETADVLTENVIQSLRTGHGVSLPGYRVIPGEGAAAELVPRTSSSGLRGDAQSDIVEEGSADIVSVSDDEMEVAAKHPDEHKLISWFWVEVQRAPKRLLARAHFIIKELYDEICSLDLPVTLRRHLREMQGRWTPQIPIRVLRVDGGVRSEGSEGWMDEPVKLVRRGGGDRVEATLFCDRPPPGVTMTLVLRVDDDPEPLRVPIDEMYVSRATQEDSPGVAAYTGTAPPFKIRINHVLPGGDGFDPRRAQLELELESPPRSRDE